jgi:hypothetical protein
MKNNNQNREMEETLRKQASKQASLRIGLSRLNGWRRGQVE